MKIQPIQVVLNKASSLYEDSQPPRSHTRNTLYNWFKMHGGAGKILSDFNLCDFSSTSRAIEYVNLMGLSEAIGGKYDPEYETSYDFDEAMRQDKFMLADPRDLARLHFLTLKRKSVVILEFGSGVSTFIFAHALSILQKEHLHEAREIFRQDELFVVHSIEEDEKWLDVTRRHIPEELKAHCRLHHSPVSLIQRNGLFSTVYNFVPNVCPTMIYLDGPSQYATNERIRGFGISSKDRMPMSADLLYLEHFLLPGSLIVVDGRTANARFLKCNFQRNWKYEHDITSDIHLFEMQEDPLGSLNAKQIDFLLPEGFML